jgi:hypothetical protein
MGLKKVKAKLKLRLQGSEGSGSSKNKPISNINKVTYSERYSVGFLVSCQDDSGVGDDSISGAVFDRSTFEGCGAPGWHFTCK